jgi:protocatechuate 3,4-dioxygenase, alpha subunit
MTVFETLVTPSQTVGPFFELGLGMLAVPDLAGPGVTGQPITIQGTIFDGDGRPVTDALLETWQADAHGRYAAPGQLPASVIDRGFRGFGRVATDAAGHFRLRTVRPGPVAGPHGTMQAPHLAVAIFMRGLLRHLATRLYFADSSNDGDTILNMVDPLRRPTLLAVPQPGTDGVFTWNVRLQGPEETVFFDI